MKRKRRTHDLARDFDLLLRDLCEKGGFCSNRFTGAMLVRDHPVLTGDVFATLILEAEGMKPGLEKHLRREIERRFTDRYGESVSESAFVADRSA